MKNRSVSLFIVLLAISTVVFAVLWRMEMNNKDDFRQLAQWSVTNAYTSFVEYQERGDESSYWNGVAEFKSFQNAYHILTEGTNKATNYTFCNEVYADLVFAPETCQNQIQKIVEVMELLSLDVQDENGYIGMSQLRNVLGSYPK